MLREVPGLRVGQSSIDIIGKGEIKENKYTYACGKEDLKPSYTYNAELGYTLKSNFNIAAYYSYSDDVFFQMLNLNPEINVSSFLKEFGLYRLGFQTAK